MMPRPLRLGVVLCALAALTGCGGETATPARSGAAAGPRATLRETPPPLISGVEPSLQVRDLQQAILNSDELAAPQLVG